MNQNSLRLSTISIIFSILQFSNCFFRSSCFSCHFLLQLGKSNRVDPERQSDMYSKYVMAARAPRPERTHSILRSILVYLMCCCIIWKFKHIRSNDRWINGMCLHDPHRDQSVDYVLNKIRNVNVIFAQSPSYKIYLGDRILCAYYQLMKYGKLTLK